MANYFSYLSGKIQQYAVSENPILSKNKKYNKSLYLIIAVIAAVIVAGAVFFMQRNSSTPAPTVFGDDDQRVEIQKPLATQQLQKTFEFPLKDGSGKEVSKIKYELLNAELRDEIIVKGKRATAIKGRMFLIINLKITNDFNKTIQINTRDYLRLNVNKGKEKLAPEIHNDPVEIQADSTKYTRIGFPINDTDKDLVLSVGEISGSKQTVNLTLKP